MNTRIRSILSATVLVMAITAGSSHGQVNSIIENFTTTVYKDTVNTTADWNTGDGELKLFPFTPTLVGTYNTPGRARAIAVSGDMAFIADQLSGLHVIDISDPANPTLLGTYDTPGAALGVAVDGDYAFIADSGSGLLVFDISNPASPVLLGSYDTPGFASDVVISGDHAFVADYSGDLQIINISNPALPTLAGTLSTPGNANGIAVDGDYAFIADENFGLCVVDISDPANPAAIGFLDTPAKALGIAVDGDYAFIADQASLLVIDISDPTNPALIGNYNTPGVVRKVAVDGDLAFLADGTSGLQVIDITDPTNPVLIDSYNTSGEARDVAVAGTRAFVAGELSGLQIIEISDPASPAVVGTYGISGNVQDLVVAGDLAFVVAGSSLKVIDISDPSNPSLVANFNTVGSSRGVAVAGDLAFVVSGVLQIIDISDPTNPTVIGTYGVNFGARRVAVTGDLAFFTDGSLGLQIIDISDPTNPTAIGTYDTPGSAHGVAVAGDLAFVADVSDGLQIIDISDPTNPTLTGTYDTPGSAYEVTVDGDLAFVADADNGLVIINIFDPTNPTLTGTYDTGDARAVATAGDLVFVADADNGLQIIDISDPSNPTLHGTSGTVVGSGVAVAGDFAFFGANNALKVIQVFQHEVVSADNTGRSLVLDAATDPILRARLSTTQSSGVDWEVSADAGANFQAITPDGNWDLLTVPGDDLQWRSTHTWAPGLNPSVSDLQIEWLNDFGVIASVSDIPNDQGKQVSVEWTRSGHDFVGDPSQIVEYAVYRKIDPDLATTSMTSALTAMRSFDDLSPSARDNAVMMQAAGWHFLVIAPVRVEDSYAVVVPTLADSTIAQGQYQSTFMVSALTATPGVFFDSPPDSGYSIDNLAPSVPASFVIAYNTGSGNTLAWDESPEADFQYFHVYRSNDPNFIPTPGDLVHSTTSTGWVDPDNDGGAVYYKVTATDFSGNESDAASAGTVTSVPDTALPDRWALHGNVPNPFNPTTEIRYSVPAGGGEISLRIYDARGRLVRSLVEGQGIAGERSVTWNGRNERGQAVASGVYFYRLTTAGFAQTRKMIMLK